MKDYDRLIIAVMVACLFGGWLFVEALTWIFTNVTVSIAN